METSNNQIPPKNYTYDNWWNGDVTLVDATRYFEKGDEPVIVNWEDFSESDVNRIKEKQMELFKAKVNALLNPVIKQFNKRYEASKMKSTYLRDERKQCWYVMFGELPNYEIVQLDQWRISHTNQYLSDVQDYVERTIKNGIDDGLGFIHSPNCKYQDISKPDSRIYAKFVWIYYNWLCKFSKSVEASVSSIPTIHQEFNLPSVYEVIKPIEPKNKYPHIFKNGYAFDMFIELKNLTIKQETVLSDYAFIFHKMKKYEFIGKDVKHKSFIDILNKDFQADITEVKFPVKNQISKNVIFSSLLEKYKHLIESLS